MKFTVINIDTFKASMDSELLKMISVLPPIEKDKLIQSLYIDEWIKVRERDLEQLTDYELGIALKVINGMITCSTKLRWVSLGVQCGLCLLINARIKSNITKVLLGAISVIGVVKLEKFITDVLSSETSYNLQKLITRETIYRERLEHALDDDHILDTLDMSNIPTATLLKS